jgi:phenylalanyl-tRNA synthetase beta subunit
MERVDDRTLEKSAVEPLRAAIARALEKSWRARVRK